MKEPELGTSGKAALAAQAWVEVCELLDMCGFRSKPPTYSDFKSPTVLI